MIYEETDCLDRMTFSDPRCTDDHDADFTTVLECLFIFVRAQYDVLSCGIVEFSNAFQRMRGANFFLKHSVQGHVARDLKEA